MAQEKNKSTGGRDSVRALTRGLSILRFVNEAGAVKPGEIASSLNIPRPTVYRLLRTLEEEGYVAFSSSNSRVRVTRFAGSLGDGSALNTRLCTIAGPLLSEYAQKIVWPLDLSIYENAAMVIQETTHGRSPMSIDRGMVGYRLPILRTSAGRAYLGHCSEIEKQVVINHVSRLNAPEDRPFLDEKSLTAMLIDVKKDGYASRNAGEFRPKTSSIAWPIVVDGTAVGSISMIWISTAMSLKQAIGQHGDSLCELSQKLQNALEVEELDQ